MMFSFPCVDEAAPIKKGADGGEPRVMAFRTWRDSARAADSGAAVAAPETHEAGAVRTSEALRPCRPMAVRIGRQQV